MDDDESLSKRSFSLLRRTDAKEALTSFTIFDAIVCGSGIIIRSVSGSGNRHPISTERVPAVAMIG